MDGATVKERPLRAASYAETSGFSPFVTVLLVQRATAIRRHDMRQQEIRHALIGVDLVFDAREAVPFVLVDLVIYRSRRAS